MAVVQIGEQAGLGGFPAEGLAGDEVGRRVALRDDVREEPEVDRHHQHVGGDAHDGQVQTAVDGLGDVAERDGPVGDRVPVAACGARLQRQAEQGGDVAGVHSVPRVGAVSGVADDAFLLGQRDQLHEEACLVGRAVRDVGDPHDRRPHTLVGQADDGGLHDVANPQGARVLIAAGKGRVLLGDRPAQVPGRADVARRDQRLAGPRLAQRSQNSSEMFVKKLADVSTQRPIQLQS